MRSYENLIFPEYFHDFETLKPKEVDNFHVEDYECYYVSEQKVTVHNNNPCGEFLKRKGNALEERKRSF